jgi:hypothetical protein
MSKFVPSLFGGNKGKLSLGFVFVMLASLALVVMSASGVFSAGYSIQAHEPSITLSPDAATCGDLPDKFTVSIYNEEGYGIYNVKIYSALTNIDDLVCGPAPEGWTFEGFKFGIYCEYLTNPQEDYVIDLGESLDFTFDATINQDDCESSFRITTLDNEAIVTGSGQGTEVDTRLSLKVDCTDPIINKDVGQPKIECDEEGCDWWISGETIIEFLASDSKEDDECNIGMDYCEYEVYIDGEYSEIYSDLFNSDEGESIVWEEQFNEDSNHEIKVV